ncbi:hypothetical protein SME13J_04280 [Serratia marcescens]|nr:hypothetical protein SME13J_04280 [Serratia marcescens]
MWYTTGKITVTNKNANVTATGTQWSVSRHGVLPGMIFIGPDGKLYEIQRVDSDTSLTLSAPYSGPTAKDQAYAIITTYEGDLTQFSAKFSNLLASFGGNRQDLLNWLTAKGDVSITKDDGSKLTVPSLDKINQTKLNRGDCGVGGSGRRISGADVESRVTLMQTLRKNGGEIFRVGGGASIGMPPDGASIHLMSGDVSGVLAINFSNGNVYVLTCNGAGLAAGNVVSSTLWGTSNTTVDANGFIKKASPIARLSGAPEKMADDYLDGFTLSGYAAVNSEAAGVSAERVSTGVYKVTGALGFAEEGWNIEVPQDVNGNRLCFVEADTAEDGTITVKVSKRRFDIDTAAIVSGEPMDIPAGRWIDLRLEMPVRKVEDVDPDKPEPIDD